MASHAATAASAAASRAAAEAAPAVSSSERGSIASYDSCQARCTGPNASCFSARVRSLHSSASASSPGACRATAAAVTSSGQTYLGLLPSRSQRCSASVATSTAAAGPSVASDSPMSRIACGRCFWSSYLTPVSTPRLAAARLAAVAMSPRASAIEPLKIHRLPRVGDRRGKIQGPFGDLQRLVPAAEVQQRLGHVDREERAAGAGEPVPLGVGYALHRDLGGPLVLAHAAQQMRFVDHQLDDRLVRADLLRDLAGLGDQPERLAARLRQPDRPGL